MLGIRLTAEAEKALTRHARDLGRPKSALARDWIVERLQRESVDEEMRRAAALISRTTTAEELDRAQALSVEMLRFLDEKDGGYDWAPDGPPA